MEAGDWGSCQWIKQEDRGLPRWAVIIYVAGCVAVAV